MVEIEMALVCKKELLSTITLWGFKITKDIRKLEHHIVTAPFSFNRYLLIHALEEYSASILIFLSLFLPYFLTFLIIFFGGGVWIYNIYSTHDFYRFLKINSTLN
jgi:hypothetical protein